ncbi:MAG: hypothetical protein JWO32_3178 [Bacteroidetes bacterium]|nr:hypothetical protein [Bacteroidota bacterium]
MKKLLVLFLLCLNSGFLIGQIRTTLKKNEVPVLVGTPEIKSHTEENEYLGYEIQIKEVLIEQSSLKNVPKRQLNQNKEEYLKTLNKWVATNGPLIRQEKRSLEFQ